MNQLDKRYPIGRFEHTGEISSSQRDLWINEIEEFPVRLKDAVRDLSEEQLDLEYREGGWTIRQVVHHLADSHMNSFIRFKLALTEDTPEIKPYYEERWAELPDSVHTNIQLSIQLLEALHQRWVVLLRSLSEADFQKQFYHPGSEEVIRLDYNVGIYAWHGNHHIAHITGLRRTQNI